MLRTRWLAVTLVTTLWFAAPHGASAQIVPVPAHVQFDPYIDVIYTGNGQWAHCTTPDVSTVETVLEPEVGDTNTAFTLLDCGEVTVAVLRYLSVQHTTTRDNMLIADSAYMRVEIEVLFHDTGHTVVLYDSEVGIGLNDSRARWIYRGQFHELTDVHFEDFYDTYTTSFRW